jgi:hypothetical protein
MDLAVIKPAIIWFFVTRASHIIQPRVRERFFVNMHHRGGVGSFHNGLFHFPRGVLIIAFGNGWYSLPVVVM